jgi:hypothetical protein
MKKTSVEEQNPNMVSINLDKHDTLTWFAFNGNHWQCESEKKDFSYIFEKKKQNKAHICMKNMKGNMK